MYVLLSLLLISATVSGEQLYYTSWIGNSYHGAGSAFYHFQQWVEGICVDPGNGNIYANSRFDEGFRDVGIYGPDGGIVGKFTDMHFRGGFCAAKSRSSVYLGAYMEGSTPVRYGIRRFLPNGNIQWTGGVSETGSGAGNWIFLDPPATDHIRGIVVTDEYLNMFVGNPGDNMIHHFKGPDSSPGVFQKIPLADGGTEPGPMASFGDNVFLMVQTMGSEKMVYKYNVFFTNISYEPLITGLEDPGAIAVHPVTKQIWVCENGSRQRVLIFDQTGGDASSPAGTLGVEGGIWSETTVSEHGFETLPGESHPYKFAGLTGIGFSSNGSGGYDVVVACNGPKVTAVGEGTGAVMRKYDENGLLIWEKLGLEFLDCADADPGTDAIDVFTKYHHYVMDYSKPRGQEWTWKGLTLDPVKHPDDFRAKEGPSGPGDPRLLGQSGTQIRRINGKRFMYVIDQQARSIGIYRFTDEDEIAIPCGLILAKEDLTFQDEGTDNWYIWIDKNGDGRIDDIEPPDDPANEVERSEVGTGEYHIFGIHVDTFGDVWTSSDVHGIFRYRMELLENVDGTGTDIPSYGLSSDRKIGFGIPPEFTMLLRCVYVPNSDGSDGTMYLGGFTDLRPLESVPGAENTWGSLGTEVLCYENWLSRTHPLVPDIYTWRTGLERDGGLPMYIDPEPTIYGALKSIIPNGLSVAGDYVFVSVSDGTPSWDTMGYMMVYRSTSPNRQAVKVDQLNAEGPVVRGAFYDIVHPINAYQRDDGEYLIFAENVDQASVLMHRWTEADHYVTTKADSGPGSLRAVLSSAGNGDTIAVANHLSGSINLYSDESLVIDKNIRLIGSPRPDKLSINVNPTSMVPKTGLIVTAGATDVEIHNLRITNGGYPRLSENESYGGGLLNHGQLLLTNMDILKSEATYGGGICNYGDLEIDHMEIFDNTAVYGGGICNFGTLSIHNTGLTGNEAVHGGGIAAISGRMNMDYIAVQYNTATSSGGGVYVGPDTVTAITVSRINDSSADTGGGLHLVPTSRLYLSQSNIYGNIASITGGAGGIQVDRSARILIDRTNVYSNRGFIGGIGNNGHSTILQSSLYGNRAGDGEAAGSGGGIANTADVYSDALGRLTLFNSTVSSNDSADHGGGIYNVGSCLITNTTISENHADYNTDTIGTGGGIYHDGEDGLLINNSIVCKNHINSLPGTFYDIEGVIDPLSTNNLIDVDPYTQVLAFQGGLTKVHGLLSNSPAIDQGDNLLAVDPFGYSLASDQRCFDRYVNGITDIGSFEYGATELDPPLVWPTPPAAPTNLTASTTNGTQITLNWDDMSSNEGQFIILQKDPIDSEYHEIATTGENSTAYLVTGLAPNQTYTFKLYAMNLGGYSTSSNTASAYVYTPYDYVVDDADASILYSGTWVAQEAADGRIERTTHETEEVNAYAEFTFTGSSVSLIGEKQPWGGTAKVYLDGMLQEVVDYYSSSSNQYQQLIYQSDPLSYGTHTIKVVKATGSWIYVDAFRYTAHGPGMISGSVFGSPPAGGDPSYDASKAFDGDINTYFQSESPNGGYAGLDTGIGESYRVASICFHARIGYSARLMGGRFQGSNESETSGYVDLYTIVDTPEPGRHEVMINDPTGYRYLRYLGPDGSYGNIAEVEFYGYPVITTETAPCAPTDLTAAAVSTDQINLSWSDHAENESGYILERKSGTTPYMVLTVRGPDTESYSDMNLTSNTVYTYRIRSYNDWGESHYAGPVSAGTWLDSPPPAPTQLTATAGSDRIELSWSPAGPVDPAVLYYVVYRSETSGGPYERVSVAFGGTQISDTTVYRDTTYYYVVTSMNTLASESVYSEEVFAALAGGAVPNGPSELSGTALSLHEIDLLWEDNSLNEDGFIIERGLNRETFSVIADLPANSSHYVDGGLSAGTSYTYRVQAYNASGSSLYSNRATISTITPPAPSAPTGLSATTGARVIHLSWDANMETDPPIEHYAIYRSIQSGLGYTLLTTVPVPELTYSDTSLTSGMTYYYTIRAVDSFPHDSMYSNEVYATPAYPPLEPSDLSAVTSSYDRIDLSWQDNADNEAGIRIERRVGMNSYETVADLPADSISYSDTGLSGSTEYTYRVSAYNTDGTSPYSNESSATTLPAPVPASPSGLSAWAVSYSSIGLSWTDNATDEDGFRLERKTSVEPFTVIADTGVDIVSYTDTGLLCETTYTYRLVAYNSYGDSEYSNDAGATTLPLPVPASPSNLTATAAGPDQIDLSWIDHAEDEDGLRIERSEDGVVYSLLTELPSDSASYSDTGLSYATHYTYRVAAYNGYGSSGYSNEAGATTLPPVLASPTDLSASAVGNHQIDLSWTDNTDNEEGFRIERRLEGGVFEPVAMTAANTVSYSDTELNHGTLYCYRVLAYLDVYESGYSSESCASTTSVVFSTTVDDSDTAITYTGVWDARTGISGRYNETTHESDEVGAEAVMTFTGFELAIIAECQPWGGEAEVYIDDELEATASFYSAAPDQLQQTITTISGLSNGSHTIRIRKVSGGWIYLDALEYSRY